MKKIIRLTEQDLKIIVSTVLSEQYEIDKVKNIQRKLMSLGYDLGPKKDDGIYGKFTRAAVVEFQKKNNIKPTGFVGTITSKALGVEPLSKTQQSTKVDDKTKVGDTAISTNIDPKFQSKFLINKLSDKDSTWVCKAGQENCGQFVNDFSKKLDYVGNAWLAHDTDRVGKRVFSSYVSLTPEQTDKILDIFKKIEKQGGPKENGLQSGSIKKIQNELIKPVDGNILKVDDVVGIYYPPSSHHEEAFYEAGKPYFIKDKSGNWIKGKTISSGRGFGLNTHVGIVGGIKNGVPLIFHNIGGDVYSDPYNKLRGGGKIVWVKRS